MLRYLQDVVVPEGNLRKATHTRSPQDPLRSMLKPLSIYIKVNAFMALTTMITLVMRRTRHGYILFIMRKDSVVVTCTLIVALEAFR